MDNIFTYALTKEMIYKFYNYNHGEYFIKKIDMLDIIEESDIVFPKNFRISNKLLELYVLKLNKIYMISFDEKDNEIIIFKVIDKKDINNIKFSVGYESDYKIEFSFKDDIIELKDCDVSETYLLRANNTLKEIIKYLNN